MKRTARRNGKPEELQGELLFFLYPEGAGAAIGITNADDYWQALEKFRRGVGMHGEFERGNFYEIKTHVPGGEAKELCMKFRA